MQNAEMLNLLLCDFLFSRMSAHHFDQLSSLTIHFCFYGLMNLLKIHFFLLFLTSCLSQTEKWFKKKSDREKSGPMSCITFLSGTLAYQSLCLGESLCLLSILVCNFIVLENRISLKMFPVTVGTEFSQMDHFQGLFVILSS